METSEIEIVKRICQDDTETVDCEVQSQTPYSQVYTCEKCPIGKFAKVINEKFGYPYPNYRIYDTKRACSVLGIETTYKKSCYRMGQVMIKELKIKNLRKWKELKNDR
jgi:hypothetical protein